MSSTTDDTYNFVHPVRDNAPVEEHACHPDADAINNLDGSAEPQHFCLLLCIYPVALKLVVEPFHLRRTKVLHDHICQWELISHAYGT